MIRFQRQKRLQTKIYMYVCMHVCTYYLHSVYVQ